MATIAISHRWIHDEAAFHQYHVALRHREVVHQHRPLQRHRHRARHAAGRVGYAEEALCAATARIGPVEEQLTCQS